MVAKTDEQPSPIKATPVHKAQGCVSPNGRRKTFEDKITTILQMRSVRKFILSISIMVTIRKKVKPPQYKLLIKLPIALSNPSFSAFTAKVASKDPNEISKPQ